MFSVLLHTTTYTLIWIEKSYHAKSFKKDSLYDDGTASSLSGWELRRRCIR